MEDLFDLKNLADLPPDLANDIFISGNDVFSTNLTALLKIAGRSVTIDELRVAYFRKYTILKTRQQMNGKLYKMGKQGRVTTSLGRPTKYALTPGSTPCTT